MSADRPTKILIAREPGETRYALLAEATTLEIALIRDGAVEPGAIYIGRVGAALPDGHACMVDLGRGEPGFLQSSRRLPSEGQMIQVEVVGAPGRGKGPTLRRREAARLSDGSSPEGPPRKVAPAPTPASEWLVRYGESIQEVMVANSETLRGLDLPPDRAILRPRVACDLLEDEGVDDAIESALLRSVPLPSGGSMIIEQTAAAWMIDINGGRGPVDAANTEAMMAFARHLRLRNLSGHFLVDLIPARHRSACRNLLADLVAKDPVQTQIAGFTPLGMLELTRRRRREALPELLVDGDRSAPLAIAYRALRLVVRQIRARPTTNLLISVNPRSAALLAGELSQSRQEAEAVAGCKISISGRDDFAADRIELSAPP